MIDSPSRTLLIVTAFSFATTFSVLVNAQSLALPKPRISTVQNQPKIVSSVSQQEVSPPQADSHKPINQQAAEQTRSDSSTQRWAVKVGRFSSEGEVKKTVTLLQNKSFDGFVKEIKTAESTFSEVYAGPTKHRSEAEKLYNRLKQAHISGKVVPTEFNEEQIS